MGVIQMKGLRTKEDSKFIEFFKIVQKRAEETGNVNFLDTGEGHDLITDELDCEDLSGWLIPDSKAKEFEKDFINWQTDAWWDFYAFANWEIKDDKIVIVFEIFDDNGNKIRTV